MEGFLTESQLYHQPILVQLRNQQHTSQLSEENEASDLILFKIYQTLYLPSNHRDEESHKISISVEQTHQTLNMQCKCKKSKCLKLYCQCFANGSFCRNCNCQSCQNTQQFTQVRAKAIDSVMTRATVPFGHKTLSIKGCNCKKTDCTKRYCQCFSIGDKCTEYCKCISCQNC